jgi:hypothetical protein
MDANHPTTEQRQAMRTLVDDIGIAEALSLMGSIIAHDHPDMHCGTEHRTAIFRIVGKLKVELPSIERRKDVH